MLEILKSAVSCFRREIKVYQLLLRDSRVPQLSKCLLGLALAYAVSPIDLIPDFIPIFGQLDDLIIGPALLLLAFWLIPEPVLKDCRAQAEIN